MSEKHTYLDYEATAEGIRKALKRWKECQKDEQCDKTGFGLNLDSRFSGIKIEVSIDSWLGYYGSSSCSTIFNCYNPEVFKKAFLTVLRSGFLDLMCETASQIEREAGQAKEAEIARLEDRLAELKNPTRIKETED